jgi:steroid 5-alpha reductase family enzyme
MPFHDYSQIGLLIFVFMSTIFVVAQFKKNNSIVDYCWGIGFCVVTAFLLFREYNNAIEGQPIISLCFFSMLIFVWGTRLGMYIYVRNRGQDEDWRYRNFRKAWGKHQQIGAFLQVFMLQGIFMFIISLPIMHTFHQGIINFNLLHYIGFFIWAIGFYFEAVGDAQLYSFKKDPANRGKPIRTGLWKYSRHPNYFGEILVWWGIWIISIDMNHPLTTLISLLSPVTITFLLTRVSGVPLTESKYKDRPEYQEYLRETPALFPKFF